MDSTSAAAVDHFFQRIATTASEMVDQTLGRERSGTAVTALAQGLAGLTDDVIARGTRLAPPEVPLACGPGCDSCCRLMVVIIDPVRLFRLAAVWNRLGGERLPARLADFPCPLLADGRCRTYADRPLICRAFNSQDADGCARGRLPVYDHAQRTVPGADPFPHLAVSLINRSLAAGLERLGLESRPVRLAPGLGFLVGDPAWLQRWLAGARLPDHIIAVMDPVS